VGGRVSWWQDREPSLQAPEMEDPARRLKPQRVESVHEEEDPKKAIHGGAAMAARRRQAQAGSAEAAEGWYVNAKAPTAVKSRYARIERGRPGNQSVLRGGIRR